jgi:translation initiation factor 2 alpha subunit (eIF-2alpha)
MNMFKYMISIIEIIQQRILHHEELDELKAAENSDAVNEFDKFMNTFSSDKNAINREIFNSLTLTDDKLKNLIEINDDEIEMKYSKIENDAKMTKNEYEKKKKKKRGEKTKRIMRS